MKVISGKYKGRNIEGFTIGGTRPTMDRVKESLFAMIQEYIPNKIILDLFSGSGNLGIEALSNGADHAYLCDKNIKAIKTIEKNMKNIGITDYTIICSDYKKCLEKLAKENIKIDVIFLDPPYDTEYIKNSIEIINNTNILNDNGLIICESDKIEKIVYPNIYNKIKEKKYGDKYIVILKKI